MTALDKEEIRLLYSLVDRALAATTERHPKFEAVREKLQRMLAEGAGRSRWGAKVFEMTLPFTLAPTLNRYAELDGWMAQNVRKQVGRAIQVELHKWPRWRAAAGMPRAVRVTRYSTRRPDEIGIDNIGGKVPIDCMVRLGILSGDTGKRLEREAAWEKSKDMRLTIEVFEILGAKAVKTKAK